MKFLIPFFVFLLCTTSVVSAQESALVEAAREKDGQQVAKLLESHRLGAIAGFKHLAGEYAAEKLNGKRRNSRRSLAAAALIADTYEKTFGEAGLANRYADLTQLDTSELRIKMFADSLYEQGVILRTSDREVAFSLFHQADSLYQLIGDRAGIAESTGQMGYVSWWLDRPAYLTFNQKALELRRQLDDRQLIGNSLNDLGLYYRAISRDYEAALSNYLESESIRWVIRDSVALSRTLPNIALSYEYLGDFDTALDYYEKGAQLYWAIGDTARYITQRNNAIGVLTDYQERHSDALVELLGLKQEMQDLDDPRTEALVTNQLGIVNRRLGDFENAIANYLDVIRLSEENDFQDLLAGAQNNIGVAFLYMNRAERAIPYFEKANVQFEEQESYDGAIETLINLGSANFDTKDYLTSTKHLERAHNIATESEDRLSLGTIEVLLGNSRLYGEGPDAASAHFDTALEIARDFEIPELTMTVLFGLGDLAELDGRPEEALSRYEEGFAALESARALLVAEEDKAGYIAQTRYLFEDVVDFLTTQAIETGEERWIESAFNFSEQARARAFVDQLAEAIAGVNSGVDSDLLSDQAILIDNLLFLREELTFETDRDARNELKAQIREQEEEFELLERTLRSNNTAYADLRYPEAINLAQLKSKMAADELILSYSVGDSSSTLWAVTNERTTIHQLPPRNELSAQIDLLRFALQDPARVSAEDYGRTASSLYDTLVGPASDLLGMVNNVRIIPDDVLNYVPFEALVSSASDSWADHTYLLESANLSYVQSATVLDQLELRPAIQASKQFLAVGDPDFGGTNSLSNLRGASLQALPFTGQEVNGVSTLFTSESQDLFTGEAATESAIRNAVASNSYRYVHFATHGLIDDDRPDYSALALSQGETRGEGLLQASEIFNMSFNSELVILSACETGLGQLIQGEGMVGLTRAFMYAGASSLIVSLWSVADNSTSELMLQFYDNLITDSMDKSSALIEAKRSLLKTEATSHPFYWAPFVLVGKTN